MAKKKKGFPKLSLSWSYVMGDREIDINRERRNPNISELKKHKPRRL